MVRARYLKIQVANFQKKHNNNAVVGTTHSEISVVSAQKKSSKAALFSIIFTAGWRLTRLLAL
jgi:hypothetical protein